MVVKEFCVTQKDVNTAQIPVFPASPDSGHSHSPNKNQKHQLCLCCPNLKPTTITSHLPERGKVPENHHFLPSFWLDKGSFCVTRHPLLTTGYICLYAHKAYHASVYPCVQRCSSPSLFCFQKSPQYTAGLQVFLLNGGTEFASRRWSENRTKTKKGLQISPFSTKLQARL